MSTRAHDLVVWPEQEWSVGTTRTTTRMFIRGVVEHGDERGRTIGFPTANLAVAPGMIQPQDGVFAALVHLSDGSTYDAAISVGRRTTFYGEAGVRLVEAHLLDFSGDLYDQIVVVELVEWLRGQVTFTGVDALKDQLARDVLRSRDVLSTLRAAA
jgi:riboflavin kinase/FMN adenylyltransferase